jgi:prepilin-type processing-associated H-X9-DG protein
MKNRWMEMIAAVGCVAFVLAILIPVTGQARGWGKAEVCMANLHLLMRSWLVYAEDNDLRIVGSATYEADGWQSHGYPAWQPTTTIRVKNFVAYPQDPSGAYRNNLEIEDEYRGLQRGGLWPYIETVSSYHCPSDTRYLKPPASGGNGKGGFRSYSIGCPYNGYAIGEGWSTGEFYYTVYRTTEIVNPSGKFVFLEEQDPDGWNINTFDIYIDVISRWPGDPLGAEHNERSQFGFADGHGEVRQWLDPTNIFIFDNQLKNSSAYPYGPNEGKDLVWFISHYLPGPRRP